MQINLTIADSDDKAEVAELLAHLQAYFSGADTFATRPLFVAPAVAPLATPPTADAHATPAPEAPKTRKPRTPKAADTGDMMAAYNAIAAATAAPAEDNTQTAVLAAEVAEEAASVEAALAEEAAIVNEQAHTAEVTLDEKREYVRLAIVQHGIVWAFSALSIPKGSPPLPQMPATEIERMYAVAVSLA